MGSLGAHNAFPKGRVGSIPASCTITRRMLMAWDHRYRPLAEGEIIEATDEVFNDVTKEWQVTIERCVGTKAPAPNYTSHRMYRRLKEP